MSLLVEDVDGDDGADDGATSGWQVLKDLDGELVVGSQIEVKVSLLFAVCMLLICCYRYM